MGEYDIGQKSDTQIHYEKKLPINDRLRGIVDPLTDHFVQEIGNELEHTSFEDRMEVIKAAGNVYELPYGRIGMLPPALFGEITETYIKADKKLAVPKKDQDIETRVDEYLVWAQQQWDTGKYTMGLWPSREKMVEKMTKLKGMKYPEAEWMMAALRMQQALSNETTFLMDGHRENRLSNAGLDYDQLNKQTQQTHRPYKSYVLIMSSRVAGDRWIQGTRDYTQLPVGEYGAEAATKLARVTSFMSDFIKTSYVIDRGVRNHLDSKSEELLAEHTARSRDRHESSMSDYAIHGVNNTLTEGVLSMAQVISFLTAEKVEGYDTHDQLVNAILHTDIIEQFTRLVRPGYIGPATLSGLHMPQPIIVRDGRVVLNPEVVKILNSMRKEYRDSVMAKWALHEAGNSKAPQTLGLTCPAAAPKGAITAIKEGIFKAFYSTDI